MTQSIAPASDIASINANDHHLIHMLSAALPPPLDPSPEALDQRDKAAIAQVASLCPTAFTHRENRFTGLARFR
jgi:hypothetical protein